MLKWTIGIVNFRFIKPESKISEKNKKKVILLDSKKIATSTTSVSVLRFAWLDVLRFLSTLIVFSAHCLSDKNCNHLDTSKLFCFKDNFLTYTLFGSGGVGVCIFFLISGYIIPQMFPRYKTMQSFLINRFFRLFPLFLFFVIIAKLMNHRLNLMGIFLPFADFLNSPFIIHGVDWTLRIEFLYYVFLGFLFYKLKLNTRYLCILSFALLIFGFFIKKIGYENLAANFCYISYIFIGYCFYQRKWRQEYILYAVIVAMGIASWHLSDKSIHDHGNLFAYIGLLIFAIFYLLRNKIKATKVTTLLGNLTYPLYLSHYMLYPYLIKTFKYHIVSFFILLFICYLLHKFIEKPCINYGKRFIK